MTKMEHTGATKRKLKENAFTAKTEIGTLRVKIQRRNQELDIFSEVASSIAPSTSSAANKTKFREPSSDSPPKPRANQKHVPIFYEPQFRQPIKRGGSHSHNSLTDELADHSTSSVDVHSTSSSFVAQLSGGRLQSTTTSEGGIGLPQRTDPLFDQNESDGLRTLGEPVRPIDKMEDDSSAAIVPSSITSDAKHNGGTGLETYRFNPFTALQTAIDHARRSSSTNGSMDGSSQRKDTHREVGSPNSNARFYRLEPSGFFSGAGGGAVGNAATDLGPPPSCPPEFTIGNSLMGGGIDLQSAATNVNTHNLNSTLPRNFSDRDVSSTPGSEISNEMRAQLERTLASLEKLEQQRKET